MGRWGDGGRETDSQTGQQQCFFGEQGLAICSHPEAAAANANAANAADEMLG